MAAVRKIQGPYKFMSEHVQDELNRLLLEECRALEQSRPEPPLAALQQSGQPPRRRRPERPSSFRRRPVRC